MNGRIYSPKLGRMLSPDPVTQAPESGQNYDRYTYALNNPLKYTDPSGFSNANPGTPLCGPPLIEMECGDVLAPPAGPLQQSSFPSEFEIDQFDRYLDFLMGDYDFLLSGPKQSEYSANFSNGLDSSGHAVVSNGDQTDSNGDVAESFYEFDPDVDTDAAAVLEIWKNHAPDWATKFPDIRGFEDFGDNRAASHSFIGGVTLHSEFRGGSLSAVQITKLWSAIGHEIYHHNQNIFVHGAQAALNQFGIGHSYIDAIVTSELVDNDPMIKALIELRKGRS